MTNIPHEQDSQVGSELISMMNGDGRGMGSFQVEEAVERAIGRIPKVGDVGLKVSHWLHRQVLRGGEPARKAADMLHGTWLGHPLHPMLTDVAIGGWTFGVAFDVGAQLTGSPGADWAADRLVEMGTIAALPTALSGLADFSTIPKPSARTATLHGIANVIGVGLNAASVIARRTGHRRRGRILSMMAFGMTTFSGLLGGMLVYGEKVGVNHAEPAEGAEDWIAVMEEDALAMDSPQRVEVDGVGVMLYRDDEGIYAIGAVCSHAGGPLEDGEVSGGCVTCPWHDSVFDLRDGSVVHGPATCPQPIYLTRIRHGKIEMRGA